MNKGVFFKKGNVNNTVLQNKDQVKESEENKNINKFIDSIILDRSITKYIIDNFTDISLDIRDSLINFADTLENTIDYIEDKSSELIKSSRDFELSKDYRDKSMEIYEVVQKINNYVLWINENYKEANNNKSFEEYEDGNKNHMKANFELDCDDSNKLCISEDFTQKSPKAFKIDDYYSEVSDWKELTVKAADILTKRYKNNTNHEEISTQNVVLKESIENDFRDSVIDILKIYSVPLSKFYVYIN